MPEKNEAMSSPVKNACPLWKNDLVFSPGNLWTDVSIAISSNNPAAVASNINIELFIMRDEEANPRYDRYRINSVKTDDFETADDSPTR